MRGAGRSALVLAAGVLLAPLASGEAAAQALSPMRGKVTSASDSFMLRVRPFNPYAKRMKMAVRVYDAKFRPIRALVSPSRFGIAARGTRNVSVRVPFAGKARRRVRVCVEAMPYTAVNTRLRTRVCGKFIASRLR